MSFLKSMGDKDTTPAGGVKEKAIPLYYLCKTHIGWLNREGVWEPLSQGLSSRDCTVVTSQDTQGGKEVETQQALHPKAASLNHQEIQANSSAEFSFPDHNLNKNQGQPQTESRLADVGDWE